MGAMSGSTRRSFWQAAREYVREHPAWGPSYVRTPEAP
jgi:hypothetical protein